MEKSPRVESLLDGVVTASVFETMKGGEATLLRHAIAELAEASKPSTSS